MKLLVKGDSLENTDLALIEKFNNGDEMAIELLVNKYKTLVNSVARRYFLVGGDSEDLVQEGMIGLYKAVLSFNNQNSFKTFAYLCIKRQILSAIKSANRQKNLVLNNALSITSKNGIVILSGDEVDENQTLIYLPVQENTPENHLIEQENYNETLDKIKASLSDYEFGVLKYYLNGFKSEQIALLCPGKNIKSVENAIARIKLKLLFLKK